MAVCAKCGSGSAPEPFRWCGSCIAFVFGDDDQAREIVNAWQERGRELSTMRDELEAAHEVAAKTATMLAELQAEHEAIGDVLIATQTALEEAIASQRRTADTDRPPSRSRPTTPRDRAVQRAVTVFGGGDSAIWDELVRALAVVYARGDDLELLAKVPT